MWFNSTTERINSVTPGLMHIWAKCCFFLLALLRNAEIRRLSQKLFLTGIEASGLTVILPFMEQRGRGERS